MRRSAPSVSSLFGPLVHPVSGSEDEVRSSLRLARGDGQHPLVPFEHAEPPIDVGGLTTNGAGEDPGVGAEEGRAELGDEILLAVVGRAKRRRRGREGAPEARRVAGRVGQVVEERRVVALRRLELGEVRHAYVVERGALEGLPRIRLDVRALRHAGHHSLTEG
jgi:hypothetical protein